jgi:ATP-dependent DNA helicase RecG
MGQIRLLVGTHALIEESVSFHNLLLAVTDEQHRFGVRQRIKLGSGETAVQPHVLVMSATPIPRTLALILYSDLDISLIDQLPPGRQPIRTYTAVSSDRPRIEQIMRRQVQEGRQVYVVCPMIEEQADTDLKSAVSTYNRLAQQVFPDLRIGLLHGSLKTDAKDQVMQAFMQGEIQILVSTTVIEVGVDNPNANLMLIENAERFGLAQLHQLRGRIGRGEHQALCILLSDSQDEKAVSGCGPFVDRKTVSKSRKKIWSCADPENFSAHANTVFRL